MAAYLTWRGHSVGIWSRSHDKSSDEQPGKLLFRTTGVVEASFEIAKLDSLSALGEYEVIVVALPATAYFDVLPDLARHLNSPHNVVFSGSLSLAPLWLHETAQKVGSNPIITAWGTTLMAASFQPDGTLHIPFTRKKFDLASIPVSSTPQSLTLCRGLFGIEFEATRSVLDITLSNINPIAHAGQVIGNFSRIEKSEKWKLFENFTNSGIRVAEALDAERLAIAAAYGARPRTLRRHYALSYPVQDGEIGMMVRQISDTGSRTLGPATLNHRYLIEDMPYGLAFLERLATNAGIEVPMLSSIISILEVMSGVAIRKGNRIIDAVLHPNDDTETIKERCRG